MKHSQEKISFDLDGCLFVNPDSVEAERPLRRSLMRLYPDRLRKGTAALIKRLQNEGFQVWIYTSSYRTELYIKALFWNYGIRPDHIINGSRHDEEVQRDRKERLPSKMPNYYRILLHIDDEEQVVQNGKQYGFHVLRVSEQDPQWTEKVYQEAIRLRNIEK